MTGDICRLMECVVLIFGYAVLSPGAAAMGVMVWNAVVVPRGLRRPVAVFLWLQAAIYAVLLVGSLDPLIIHLPSDLLLINAVLVFAQAMIGGMVIFQMFRLRKLLATVLSVFVAFLWVRLQH